MKFRTRIFQTFILTLLFVFCAAGVVHATPKVVLDGQQLAFDVPPTIENGRTLVPFRTVFEAFGANVDWDSQTNSVLASKSDIGINLVIGKNTAYVNEKAVQLDVPPKIVNGRTLVPLRFVGESLGANVDWDGATKTVIITTGEKTGEQLKVHFIDVGQGDAILVQLPNQQVMLIDAGPKSTVTDYLQSQGVKRIDYLVATHPHADHIGGMESVIRSFDIGKIFMPRVTHTTKTFENVLLAIQEKGQKIAPAKAGLTVFDQDGLQISFVAPCGTDYDNLNNYSAVAKIQYGSTSFLLTGDAETEPEREMIASGINLKSNVLKVGHHGSATSTSPGFLNAISPEYGVISVGAGNTYNHPHQTTLDKLADAGVQVYRTDQHGTITFVSDGQTLTVRTLRNTIVPRAPDTKIDVPTPKVPIQEYDNFIGNKNTKKLHKPNCSSLPAMKNRVYFKDIDEAISAGYVPCKKCKP